MSVPVVLDLIVSPAWEFGCNPRPPATINIYVAAVSTYTNQTVLCKTLGVAIKRSFINLIKKHACMPMKII